MTRSRIATILILVVAVAFPVVALVIDAVSEGSPGSILLDAKVHELLLNSLVLAALTTVIAVILGAPAAFALAFRDFRGRTALLLLAAIPLLIPHHIQAIGWLRIIGNQGSLTSALEQSGVKLDVRAQWLGFLYPGAAWMLACALCPLITFSLLAGFRRIEQGALDAARLAAGERAAFLRLALPQAAPAFWAGAFLTFAFAVCAYAVPSLLDTPVLIQRIFMRFASAESMQGVVLALPLLVMSVLLMLLIPRAGALFPSVAQTAVSVRPRRGGLAPWLGAIPLMLAAGGPLYGLVAKVIEHRIRRPEEPSPFLTVFDRVKPAFGHSLLFTLLGVAALLLCAWPIAYDSARRRTRAIETILLAMLALPPVVLGIGVVRGWKMFADVPVLRTVYEGGILMVVFAYVGRFLPVVVRVLRNGFGAIDPDVEAAARLAGAGPWTRAVRILAPAQLPALGAAALLAYVLCLTELDATMLTYPPGYETIQVRIFNMVHYFRDDEVAALCLMAIVLALVPVAACAVLFGRPRRA